MIYEQLNAPEDAEGSLQLQMDTPKRTSAAGYLVLPQNRDISAGLWATSGRSAGLVQTSEK